MDSTQAGMRTLGYQQVAVDAATALTIPAGTCMLRAMPEAQAVRWRDDGVDPTAAAGMPLAVAQELIYTGGQMAALKFISQVAGAKVNVMYYGLI